MKFTAHSVNSNTNSNHQAFIEDCFREQSWNYRKESIKFLKSKSFQFNTENDSNPIYFSSTNSILKLDDFVESIVYYL